MRGTRHGVTLFFEQTRGIIQNAMSSPVGPLYLCCPRGDQKIVKSPKFQTWFPMGDPFGYRKT